MKPTGRLHIYPPTGPRSTGYIVADRQSLRGLADAVKSATTSTFGFETIKLYSADGHEYELVITSDVDEQEWQQLESNYVDNKKLQIKTLENYQELKQSLAKKNDPERSF
jgi:hypothetical protein